MRRRRAALAAALLAGGCIHPPRPATPSPARDWQQVEIAAQSAAIEGRYAAADSALAAFAERNPSSAESREVHYWRALFALDPANRTGSTAEARRQLDAYLADTGLVLHRTEAGMLRRVTATMDSLRIRGTLASAAGDSARTALAASTAREADAQKENQRLKDELDKTTTELERIRKRLSERKPF